MGAIGVPVKREVPQTPDGQKRREDSVSHSANPRDFRHMKALTDTRVRKKCRVAIFKQEGLSEFTSNLRLVIS